MSKPAKTSGAKGLVPRLRFSEFRAGDCWTAEPLGAVYGFLPTNSLSRDALNYDSGDAKNIHYGDIHTKFATLFDITRERVPYINKDQLPGQIDPLAYCAEGDMVFADASEDTADVGKSIELVRLNGEHIVAGQHTILARQKRPVLVLGFAGYLFKCEYVRAGMRHEAQGAKVLGISPTRLAQVALAFPAERAEQQKIADCLSSLDDLITAHADKLAALKQHKLGLLEQLFPREGETVPRLRFPEFRGAAAWQSKKLGNVAHVVRGGSPRPIADYLTDDKDGLAWLKIGDVSEGAKYIAKASERIKRSGLSKTREIHPGDLILSNSMSFGRPYLSRVSACIHDGWLAITDLPQNVSSEFMYYLLSAGNCQRYFADAAAGSGVHNLNIDIVEVAPIMVPDEREQIRVAACLSTLDTLITAQADRLAALKQHKQGLLQQLFPVMDEAAA